nr:UV-endonuclease UvdE [Aureimonas sp. AU22]BAT30120.1 UV-endonuclease UvdE [Aureimonas sp. AU22]
MFDHQHFWCWNPEGLDLRETVSAMVSTWPLGEVAKVHYSSPRTELREVSQVDRATGKRGVKLVPPVATGHADYVNPFEFAMFLRAVEGLDFDVMLEAKAKDLALFRLRADLQRYGQGLGARFGLAALP